MSKSSKTKTESFKKVLTTTVAYAMPVVVSSFRNKLLAAIVVGLTLPQIACAAGPFNREAAQAKRASNASARKTERAAKAKQLFSKDAVKKAPSPGPLKKLFSPKDPAKKLERQKKLASLRALGQ